MESEEKFSLEEFPQLLEISKILGYGTGVTIYRVEEKSGGSSRRMALKVVNKKFKKSRHIHERLRQEGNILKEIQHPNIVSFLGHQTSLKGNMFLLMEELDQSLGDYIEKLRDAGAGPLKPMDICRILVGVCKALDYLHCQKSILHGDVKSHNILIKGGTRIVKLCDFGLSIQLPPDGIGDVEDYVGTLCWAAPEALAEGPLTFKVDVFALGMVVYEMLTMKVPLFNYCRRRKKTIKKETEVKSNSEKTGSAQFSKFLQDRYYSFIEIFSWCTEKDFACRPSAKQLFQVLESKEFLSLRTLRKEALEIS